MIMETRGKTAWSLETYTIHDVVYKMGLPRTVRVTEGVYSQNEHESLSTGDIIRLEEVSELRRVMTRATLMDGDVTDLQIPLNHSAPVYVYTGSETVYKSVQELIHLFPGHVHVDSPIKVVTLDQGGGEAEEIDLSWGACLKLDKVASGQGLHCTCGDKRVCLRPFQRGRFSRIPKNDIMCFKDVVRNFSLPIKVRFIDKPPELSSVLDISQVNYFSLERVESEVAIVGHELKPDGSRVSANQLTVAMTQANDVEVQICLKNEAPPVSHSSPRVTNRAEKKRPPPVPQRSSSIPSSFGKSVPLVKTRVMNQPVPGDHTNVASVNPQPPSVGNSPGLVSTFGAKLTVHHPRKMSNPETMKEIHRGGFIAALENKLCAVPPLPARSRPPSEEATDITVHNSPGRHTPEIAKKPETGLTLNKLPPELGRQLFNNNSSGGGGGGGSNRNSKSNTPTKPLSNRSSVDDYQTIGNSDSDSSENADEAEYISMESTCKLLKRKPPTPIRSSQPTPQPAPSTAPDIPLRNRSNSSSQNHAGAIAGLAQNAVSRMVPPLQEQQQFPFPAVTIETAAVRGVPMNEGVMSVMQVPISSQNLDQYYTSIPKKFRQSLVLVHKEFFNRYGDSKPTGAVTPMSRLPPPAETSTFATLSVSETVRCFRECRLTELADLCEKEGLDGCFIDKLTPDDLSKDPFNLTVLHRMKVEQIKHGWRPCYE